MTIDEIRDWATASGFSPCHDGRLGVDLGPFRVEIEFRARTVLVRIVEDEGADLVARIDPRHAFINEHGVPEGLGLSAAWLTRFPRGAGMAPPPWMTQAYLDAVGWTGAPAADRPSGA